MHDRPIRTRSDDSLCAYWLVILPKSLKLRHLVYTHCADRVAMRRFGTL